MGDAHKAAVEIVADVLASLNDALPYEAQAESILDALSAGLHAEIAIERGGLQQVGWGGCTERRVIECNDDDGHEWHLVHEDGTSQLDPDHPRWPVYRLSPGVSSVAEAPPQEEIELAEREAEAAAWDDDAEAAAGAEIDRRRAAVEATTVAPPAPTDEAAVARQVVRAALMTAIDYVSRLDHSAAPSPAVTPETT